MGQAEITKWIDGYREKCGSCRYLGYNLYLGRPNTVYGVCTRKVGYPRRNEEDPACELFERSPWA